MYILGVDGGGTKTNATLYHPDVGMIWTTLGAATNPLSTSFNHSVQTVIQMIEKAITENKLPTTLDMYISLGIAGLGREPERKKWLAQFHHAASHLPAIKEIIIENDGKIALYSATYGKDGIVSICGTGALTFGINEQEQARVGGWGHLIGCDPGSGYHLGSQALEAIFDAEDSIGKETRMTDLLLKGEGVRTAQDLVPIIYQKEQEKQRIAAYARYVFQAVEQRDEVAQHIMNKTAQSIAKQGLHLYQLLFANTGGEVPFVLAGGIFKNKAMVHAVSNALNEAPQLRVTLVEREPVIGSIVIALQKHGYSVSSMKKLLGDQGMGET